MTSKEKLAASINYYFGGDARKYGVDAEYMAEYLYDNSEYIMRIVDADARREFVNEIISLILVSVLTISNVVAAILMFLS